MVISGVLHHGESVLVSYFCKVDLDQNLVLLGMYLGVLTVAYFWT